MACAMIGSFGLAGPTPLTYLGPPRDAADFLAFTEVRAAVDRELSGAAQSCASKLKKNRHVLEAVARRLSQHNRIDGVEVAALLAGRGRKSPTAVTLPAVSQHTEAQPERRYE
jgi:cell division protease FtsH